MGRATLLSALIALLACNAHAQQKKKRTPDRAEPAQRRVKDEYACKGNSDCVHLPTVCPRCAPCKPTWRPVGNKAAAKRIQKMQAVVDCRLPKCRPCASVKNWRGKPVCIDKRCRAEAWAAKGGLRLTPEPKTKTTNDKCYKRCLQSNMARSESWESIQSGCHSRCRLRPPKRPALPPSKERACRRHRDCVFVPISPCSCAPCGPTWRRAFNKKALKAWRSKWAARRCKQRTCQYCAHRYLDKKAVCIKGQCTTR